MPTIIFHKNGQTFQDEVADNTNLVVRAGIRQFPFPHLIYGCGMGKCAKCTCKILKGGEHLAAPNWKEEKLLHSRLKDGFRLMCQLWISHDLELSQPDETPNPPSGGNRVEPSKEPS